MAILHFQSLTQDARHKKDSQANARTLIVKTLHRPNTLFPWRRDVEEVDLEQEIWPTEDMTHLATIAGPATQPLVHSFFVTQEGTFGSLVGTLVTYVTREL